MAGVPSALATDEVSLSSVFVVGQAAPLPPSPPPMHSQPRHVCVDLRGLLPCIHYNL